MIDFHNHILPNVDDGSNSIEMSLDMLRRAESQGITDVVNTVHYQHPKMKDKDTSYDFIISEIYKLQAEADENNINIKIHPGSEVFFDFNLTEILDNPITRIGNGKYMLIEFQTLMFPEGYEKHLYELACLGVTPIIAHPERYRPLQRDFSIIEKLINSGCLMQLDAGSILGHFGDSCKTTSEELINRKMIHLMGSDSHNNKKRNFCLKEALKIATVLIGKSANILVNENPMKVILGEHIDPFDIVDIHDNKKTFFSTLFGKITGN